MRTRQTRVLLALGWYEHRLHNGIARYALEHGWHLCGDITKEKVIPWGWEGDGILAWLAAGDDLAEFVVRAKKPTVDFSFRRPELRFPRVLLDHYDTARLAAEHFLNHGFTNFMYYSETDNWSFEERGRAFVQLVGQAGHACPWLCWQRSTAFAKGRSEWKLRRRWLVAHIKKAPKPLALFAGNDEYAMDVLDLCEAIGLVVPEEVSIIGADNCLHAVEAMHTPISSVESNLELLGYRGAALLDDLMKGKPVPDKPIRIPAVGLIARKSSDFVATNHLGIARGIRFMMDHYREPITVDDVAKAAAMSRRGFHKAFVEHIHRRPGHELNRIRIEHARKLLAESRQKIRTISERCGYGTAAGFWYAFKKATGVSPKQYRQESRATLRDLEKVS